MSWEITQIPEAPWRAGTGGVSVRGPASAGPLRPVLREQPLCLPCQGLGMTSFQGVKSSSQLWGMQHTPSIYTTDFLVTTWPKPCVPAT